jgi:hypothetical protein
MNPGPRSVSLISLPTIHDGFIREYYLQITILLSIGSLVLMRLLRSTCILGFFFEAQKDLDSERVSPSPLDDLYIIGALLFSDKEI